MRFRCSNLLVYKVFPLFDPHGLEHMANSSQTALPEILVSSNLRRPRRFAKDPRRLPKSIERRGPEEHHHVAGDVDEEIQNKGDAGNADEDLGSDR